MNSYARKSWLLASLILLFVSTSCEPILTQNPREHFTDEKLPASAFRFANQIWDLPASEKIVARVAADQKNPYLLRVGVMDNGVDFAHPDLVNQIDFGVKNGRVVSAGYDVMGGDRFGSPQILRYEYYAFGAGAILDNKIQNPPKDPFALLAKYDSDFLADFIPKLHANPALKKTLFAKFTKENFSIVGAHAYSLEEINEAAYEKRQKEKKLVGSDWKPAKGDKDALETALERAYFFIHEPFLLGEDGYPVAHGMKPGSETLFSPKIVTSYFEGGREFLKFVKTEFESYSKRTNYLKDFTQLMEFIRPRLFEVSDSKDTQVRKSLSKLAEALYFKRQGYAAKDPMDSFERAIYGSALARKLGKMTTWPTSALKPNKEDLSGAAKDGLKLIRDIANHIKKNPGQFTEAEQTAADQYLEKIQTWSNFYVDYLTRRGWDAKKGPDAAPLSAEMQSTYRRYLVRTKHPLLDPKAVDQSHGSHVSGIIAKQNENIRIVPIRVITESTKSSPVKDPQMLSSFRSGFEAWLNEPLVGRALEGRFGAAFPGKRGKELTAEIMKIFSEQIPKDFDAHKLDYRFLGEVEEAITIAGQEKLKLVNVSLGTTFDRGVIDYRNLNLKKQVESYFQFLKFEYFKWKIGKTADEKAPGTLFLVATGNDGAWRDGRSRSALPVDLSSPFLADYEDPAKGVVAPNNQIKNILGVGSLSQIDELSSFTNLLISRAPMIMAHGEAVLSSIRSISAEATNKIWSTEVDFLTPFAGITTLVISGDERFEDFLKTRFSIAGTASEIKDKLSRVRTQINAEFQNFSAVDAGLKMDLFLRFPNVRSRYSGTSMATPTLTGLLASEIQKRATQAGIPTSKLYEHPDFTPSKLIEIVMSKAEPVFKESTVISLKKWTGENIWEKSKEEKAVDALIQKAKTDACPLTGDPQRKISSVEVLKEARKYFHFESPWLK